MQDLITPQPVSLSGMFGVGTPADAANWGHGWTSDTQAEFQFASMLNAYRASGGLGGVQDIVQMLQRHDSSATLTLARWILKRQVICFEWRPMTWLPWLPWFQFRPGVTTQQLELAPVFAELAAVFDPWEMAIWFAQPNSWLANCRPADSSQADSTAVMLAGQADRVLAGG